MIQNSIIADTNSIIEAYNLIEDVRRIIDKEIEASNKCEINLIDARRKLENAGYVLQGDYINALAKVA
jgi:hypothetical protein